jgi:Na+-transporting NADH:ubiquinone oxidoreductase subunit A
VEQALATHRLKQGLDLPLAGAPAQEAHAGPPVTAVALLADDYVGLKPTFHVRPGESVRVGQLLFEDKSNPGVRFTAAAAGTVQAIHRGARRAFVSLVIALDAQPDAQVELASFRGRPAAELDAAAVRALLVESGLWTALRTRPFSRVPSPAATPYAIFVTAMDTRPHAPSVERALAGRETDFETGIACLAKLTTGPVFVCVAEDARIAIPQSQRVRLERFAGPHPAGIAGTHIHFLAPVTVERPVWHVGYQDVAAIGRLAATGRIDAARVVSLAGPSVARPRLLRTRLGASTLELTRGELRPGAQRVVAGSVLDGRTAMDEALGYLGRYHLQVSALPEGRERELFGWIAPGADKFSIWGVVLGAFAPRRPRVLTTATHGGPRAMVPIGAYERVMPLDLMPTFLLRALVMQRDDWAEEMGALELDEDDLALCTYVCPGKTEYGPLLRDALARIQREAA